MDRLTKEHRSWNMSRIKDRDTGPEMAVRSALHKCGFRFRLRGKDLPGKPDIVLPKYKTVIFVHGCFWHRHENCKYCYTPKSHEEFWHTKFQRTIERDAENMQAIKQQGWLPLIIWECELKDNPDAVIVRIRHTLEERLLTI